MLFLASLLFSYFQMSQQIQKTTANGKEMLSNPRLLPLEGTSNVMMNQNVSLSCHVDSGSPPVRYTLFKHNQKVSTLNRPDLTPGLFNLTINSASDVGEYKCKAENNITNGGKYSNSLSFTLIEPISKPVLSSLNSQAKKGQNVTLSCLSVNGSLPITYIFFKGKRSISQPVKMQKREAAMIFLYINSSSDFGTYKCRAENSFRNNTKYSNSFNFTLAEERSHSQPLIISLVLILLLFIIGFALAIAFFIIPSYKAKKFKSTRSSTGLTSTISAEEAEDDVIYTEIGTTKAAEWTLNTTQYMNKCTTDCAWQGVIWSPPGSRSIFGTTCQPCSQSCNCLNELKFHTRIYCKQKYNEELCLGTHGEDWSSRRKRKDKPVKPEEEYINISVIRREDEKAEKRTCATLYSKVLIRD